MDAADLHTRTHTHKLTTTLVKMQSLITHHSLQNIDGEAHSAGQQPTANKQITL